MGDDEGLSGERGNGDNIYLTPTRAGLGGGPSLRGGKNGGTGFELHMGSSTFSFLKGSDASSVFGIEADQTNWNTIVHNSGLTGTTRTSGFFYIPVSAGTPTGVPTPATYSNAVPFQYDTTNNKICVYNGAWKCVQLA